LNGETIAIGGIYYHGESVVAFCAIKPGENKKYPVTAWKMIKRVMDIVKERPTFAIADTRKFPNAPRMLKRLGFERIEGNIFRWPKTPRTLNST